MTPESISLTPPTLCGLDVAPRASLASVDDVRERVAAELDSGADGWVTTPQELVAYRNGGTPPSGPLLDGEFARGQRSCSLRHFGDTWLWSEVTETAGEDWYRLERHELFQAPEGTPPEGVKAVTTIVYFPSTVPDGDEGAAAPRPHLARFAGFTTDEGGE